MKISVDAYVKRQNRCELLGFSERQYLKTKNFIQIKQLFFNLYLFFGFLLGLGLSKGLTTCFFSNKVQMKFLSSIQGHIVWSLLSQTNSSCDWNFFCSQIFPVVLWSSLIWLLPLIAWFVFFRKKNETPIFAKKGRVNRIHEVFIGSWLLGFSALTFGEGLLKHRLFTLKDYDIENKILYTQVNGAVFFLGLSLVLFTIAIKILVPEDPRVRNSSGLNGNDFLHLRK